MNGLCFIPVVVPNFGVKAVLFPEIFRQIVTHGHGLFDFDCIQIASGFTDAAAGANFLIDLDFAIAVKGNGIHGTTIGVINAFFASDAFGLISNGGPTGRVEDLGTIFRCRISCKLHGNASAGTAEANLQEMIHLIVADTPKQLLNLDPECLRHKTVSSSVFYARNGFLVGKFTA